MKRLPGKFQILAGVLVAVNVIGLAWIHHGLTKVPRPVVRVLSALPASNADDADRLTLIFDRRMVSKRLVGKVVKAAGFQLSPPWPGKWVWAGTETLEYLLDEPLPPGRVFFISPTPDLTTRTGKVLDGATEFRFQTSPLRLTSCRPSATDRRHVTFELAFNQPVDPGELLRHLSVRDGRGGAKLGGVICLTKKPDRKLVVRASRGESDHVKIVLDGRLVGPDAELPLGGPLTRTLNLSPKFSLLRADVDTPSLSEIISVRLGMSQTIGGEQKLPKPAVTPAVEKLKVHRSGSELVVSAAFTAGERYTIEVPGTLLSKKGETLGRARSVTVHIPDRRCTVLIPKWLGILSPDGNMMLDAQVVNVGGLKLSASRVHQNNLVPHLRDAQAEATSRSVLNKTIKLDLPPNQPRKVAIDLRGLLGGGLGIYRFSARATNRRWISDWAVVAVTDLAITAKRERTGSLVWVTSLRTGKPVRGAEVKALTYNNQTLATGKTDERGLGRLRFPANHPDGAAWVVTAAKAGDLSYLKPGDNQWVIDEVDQSGRPHVETYEVMLYTERGVYRPGDEIHLTGIIRDGDGAIPEAFPLAVKVIRPDGRQVAELTATPADGGQGVFHATYATPELGRTGPYRFRVTLPGSEKVLGSTHALLEAFIPVRMEVKAEPTAARFAPKDSPKVAVSSRYLWDQPAGELPVSVACTLRQINFQSQGRPDFAFGAGGALESIVVPAVTGELDAQGKATLAIPLPESLKAGIYRAEMSATVTEPGGRSVSANAAAVLDRLDVHVGLRLPAGRVVPAEEPASVDWVRLTGEDKPAGAGEMAVRLDRIEYDTVLKKVNNQWIWRSVERVGKVETQRIAPSAGAEGSFKITCPGSGMYRVTVSDEKSGSTSRLTFYASADDGGRQSVPMNRPARLEIVTDRDRYLPGETAKVLVRSPLPGTLLLTVETDRVLAAHLAEVAENTAELEVPLPAEVRGGAFLSATVVRAIDPEARSWLPHRAMGIARVVIDHTPQRIPVAITADRKAEPGQRVSLTIDTGPPTDPRRPSFVHVWAVDEGILLTSAYRTPAPQAFFLAPRRPGVSSADLFLRLLPDYKRPEGMTRIGAGGPGGEVDELRRNPVPSRRREAAVIWRKACPVEEDGRLTIEMDLPDLIGQLRVMAVAIDHDGYGHAEHAITLTAPLIVETSWPRFAAPGDAFEVPVKLFNSTGRSMRVRARVEVTGPLEILAGADLECIDVPPGRPVTRLLKVRATGIGPVEARVEVEELDAGDEALKAHSETSFPVRAATALHCEVKLLAIPAGKKLTIPPSESMIRGTARVTVNVSPRPSVQLGPALEDLIDYPYGCVEQTSSQLFSLLYAPQILPSDRAETIGTMVQAGMARLWSMQTRSGGLSYWPGGTQECLWGTAYAASCLLEARSAGHKIDPRFTADLAKYLDSRLKTTGDDAPDANTKALICRVLATFGQPPHGWMARLSEQTKRLDLAGRAHLAGAFHAAGRKDRALAVLPEQAPQTAVATTTSGRLTSRVRQEAVWLLVLLDIDPSHPVVAMLAGRLEKARRNGRWGSTLENAAAIAALTRYQAVTAGDPPKFTGTIQAKDAKAVPFDHTKGVCHKFTNVAGPIVISSAGAGTVYVAVSSEGLARKGLVKPYDRQLFVGRRWFDRSGKTIAPDELRVGDLVHVAVTIRSPVGAVGNIAIVDCLPGGMEVENPRLASSSVSGAGAPQVVAVPVLEASEVVEIPIPGQPAAPAAADTAGPTIPLLPPPVAFEKVRVGTPDHVEFLDDRVVLFCTARPATQIFRYALRVTAVGEFALPPIQASCMYDPGVASLGEGGRVKIRRRAAGR